MLAVHTAWLSKWYLLPITAVLLSPNLYWQLSHVVDQAHNEVLEQLKIFYETLAAQVGCGLSLLSGLERVADEMLGDERLPAALVQPLAQIRTEVRIGLFSAESFSGINGLARAAFMERFNELLMIGLKTGSPIDQLLSSYADMLSELLRHKRIFRQKLAQKRSEFQLMMIMPVGAILAIRQMLPEFFKVLYGSVSGMALLLVVTAAYSFSCHLFYYNESRIQAEEV